jgi:hypothetical protein
MTHGSARKPLHVWKINAGINAFICNEIENIYLKSIPEFHCGGQIASDDP